MPMSSSSSTPSFLWSAAAAWLTVCPSVAQGRRLHQKVEVPTFDEKDNSFHDDRSLLQPHTTAENAHHKMNDNNNQDTDHRSLLLHNNQDDDKKTNISSHQGRLGGGGRHLKLKADKIVIDLEANQENDQQKDDQDDMDNVALVGSATFVDLGRDEFPTAAPVTLAPTTAAPTAYPVTAAQACMRNVNGAYTSIDLTSTGPAMCEFGYSSVVIGVYTDTFASEVAWTIRRNGQVDGCIQYDSLADGNTFNVYGNQVASGSDQANNVPAILISNCACYELQVYDSAEDGLDGDGRLFVSVDGFEVYNGGSFSRYSGERSGWIPLTFAGCGA